MTKLVHLINMAPTSPPSSGAGHARRVSINQTPGHARIQHPAPHFEDFRLPAVVQAIIPAPLLALAKQAQITKSP